MEKFKNKSFAGGFFWGWLLISLGLFCLLLVGVQAFGGPQTNLGGLGFQSGGAPALSKDSGNFDRNTDSLQALAEKIDLKN